MHDKQVSLLGVITGVAWSSATMLMLAGSVLGVVTGSPRGYAVAAALACHGLLASAAAAALSVKMMLRTHLRGTRDAFELGRDLGATTPLRATR